MTAAQGSTYLCYGISSLHMLAPSSPHSIPSLATPALLLLTCFFPYSAPSPNLPPAVHL
jgi:hypothetical protein